MGDSADREGGWCLAMHVTRGSIRPAFEISLNTGVEYNVRKWSMLGSILGSMNGAVADKTHTASRADLIASMMHLQYSQRDG